MTDPRIAKLADILVNYSLKIGKGEKVLIQDNNPEPDFVRALVRAVHGAGGLAFVALRDKAIERELYIYGTEAQFALQAKFEVDRMREMDAYIGFTSLRNAFAWKDIPSEKMELYNKYIWKKVHIEQRLPHTKWVVLRLSIGIDGAERRHERIEFRRFLFRSPAPWITRKCPRPWIPSRNFCGKPTR